LTSEQKKRTLAKNTNSIYPFNHMLIRENKITHSIIFFAAKSNNKVINRLKLMKLLWLADRIHINRYGRLILKDKYNALPHGSVPSYTMDLSKETLEGYFEVVGYNIKALIEFDEKYFSKSDIEVMEEVWKTYGKKGKFELRDLSHKFPEWIRFEDYINNKNLPNSYPENVADFFDKPLIDNFPFDENRVNISKSIYHSFSTIQTSLTE